MVYDLSILYYSFFNDPPTTEIYTLSLHDALPILQPELLRVRPEVHLDRQRPPGPGHPEVLALGRGQVPVQVHHRSEEHTSELQSQSNLVCRLLLEKKKTKKQHDDVHVPCREEQLT